MSSPEPGSRRPLTAGAVVGSVGRISVAVTGALLNVVVARMLGADGAGDVAIAVSLVLMLTVLTTLGVEHGIAYHVSGGRWAPRAALGSSLRMAAVLGVLGAGAGVLVRLAVPSAFGGLSVPITAVAAAALPFSLAWLYCTYLALATDRYEAYVVPGALQSASALVLVGVLAAIDDVPGAIIGLTASHVVAAAIAVRWARRNLGERADGRPDEPGRLGAAVRFGVRGYAGNALQLFNYRLDLFVLAGVAGNAAVGHYAVAVAVTSVAWLVPQALGEVVFPRVAALSTHEALADERTMVEESALRHTSLLVLVSVVVLAAASVLLIVPVYGAGFRPAIVPALILLPGAAGIALGGVLFATVVGRGRPDLSLRAALIVTPLTLVLYAVLVPAWDARGAALASTLSYLASFTFAAFAYRTVTGRRLGPALVPGRAELRDLVGVAPAIAARLRGRPA